MRHMNNKGFLLIDSLITVFVMSLICVLCYSIYQGILNYEEGYESYQMQSNHDLEDIFSDLGQCEGCVIEDESD